MKMFAGLAAVAALAGVASAHTTYLDPFGINSDVDPFFLNQGFNHLDLAAVEVFNDAGVFEFDILLNANIQSGTGTDWGKYLIAFDTIPGQGRTDNPWGRNIQWGEGADFYFGGWADGGGGGQLWKDNGGGWTDLGGGLISVDLSNAAAGLYHVEINEAILGVVPGQIIGLDVVSTGGTGGDPGVDHLSLGTIATPNWGTGSIGGLFKDYEVEPTPGTILVLGAAGLMAGRRRRA